MAIPGSQVRHSKVTNELHLFDDGYTSAVWCNFFGNPQRCLGVRYNGTDGAQSFPNKNGFPLWYIEPDFVTRSILLELLAAISRDHSVGNIEHVLTALREFQGRRNSPASETKTPDAPLS